MNGPINDGSWETSHAEGMRAVEKALPGVKTSYVDNVQFGDAARQTIMRMAASNDVVFLTTDYGDAQRQAAAAYPNVKFIVCGALASLPNLLGFYVRNYEVAYVHGVAAAKLTRSNKLGYVASFPVPSVFGDVNGWALGAQSVNPNVEVQVVTISTWYDPQAATQAVDALVSGGADVVWSIMGDNSVPQAAEKRGVWSFAWSRDARRVAPRGYVSTTALDWGPYDIEQVKAVQDGTWRTKPVPGDVLSLGRGVDRGPWGDQVPTSVGKAADAARAKLMDGSLNPFAGPIKDSSGAVKVPAGRELSDLQLATWSWPVLGVRGLKAGS
jgi:simple sugar transport system substrate-binding protein